jgi:hypothetical protein
MSAVVIAICPSCGAEFTPTRSWQSCCTKTCASRLRQERRRKAQKWRDTTSPVSQSHKWRDSRPHPPRRALAAPPEGLRPYEWPTPPRGLEGEHVPARSADPDQAVWDGIPLKPSPLDGRMVLSGDDVELEYDADGWPVLPAFLRAEEEIDMSSWRVSSEEGNTREWRSSSMEHDAGDSQKRCLSCGKIIPNTPTGRRPVRSYCSQKCHPQPQRRIIGCITKELGRASTESTDFDKEPGS